MNWIIIVVIYFLIGIGIFAWCLNRDKKINSKSMMRTDKALASSPELFLALMCLLWPFILFSEIKHRRTVNHIGKDDTE